MSVVEVTDKARVHSLLEHDPALFLEAIDENALGVDGIVSVFCEDVEAPPNRLVVRWAQASLGLRSVAHLSATRVTGLDDVVSALPIDRTEYDAHVPFWASPMLGAAMSSQLLGAVALYRLSAATAAPSPVARQCTRVHDLDIVRPMFRKLAFDAPAYVLSLKDELVSVAVVTHMRDGRARISAYTVEEHRRRGFARGVLTALADELRAMKKQCPSMRITWKRWSMGCLRFPVLDWASTGS